MAIHYIESISKNIDDVRNLISLISNPDIGVIFLDTETSDLDPYTSELLLLQIAHEDEIYVLHVGNVGKVFLTKIVKRINESELVCVGHNIKFDIKILKVNTNVMIKKVFDTMVAESVLNAGIGEKLYSLSSLVNRYCGALLDKETRRDFIGKTQKDSFSEQQITYSAYDVLYLKDIYTSQNTKAVEENLQKTMELEMQLLPVVANMELHGIHLDKEHWNKLTASARIQLRQFEIEVKDLIIDSINISKYKNALELADALCIREPAKTKKARAVLETIIDPGTALGWVKANFNVGSHKQLLTALNLAGIKTPNTNEKTLNKLKKNVIVDSILGYREFEKQVSTYGDNIIDLINPITGRIHTEYFQMGTQTGRFSSVKPNMQNLPRKGGYREGFIARPGYSLISMDYSQQEYRLAGALSNDPKIIKAYVDGWDMHTATAASRFKKDLKDVTVDERNYGKTMNFAVLYGTSEYGIMRNFSISKEDALGMLSDFFSGYERLAAFKNTAEEFIIKLGYSVTPRGRKRFFKPKPVFATPRELEKFYAQIKREGFNHIIQGGGADVTKLAMVLMDKHNLFGDKFSLILQVHDEIVAEVEDSIIKEAVEFMKKHMLDAFQPLLGEISAQVDWKVGKRWGK